MKSSPLTFPSMRGAATVETSTASPSLASPSLATASLATAERRLGDACRRTRPGTNRILSRWLLVSALVVAPAFAPTSVPAQSKGEFKNATKSPPPSGESSSGEMPDGHAIERLIEKLGADSYVTRRRARQQIRQIGFPAFEALQRAAVHGDQEVETVAKMLVQDLDASWSLASDPKPVRDYLDGYIGQSVPERAMRIGLIAELPNRIGLAVLVRICRFDPDPGISKRAAIAILSQATARRHVAQVEHAALIRDAVATSERPAIEWLRVYADDLEKGAFAAERWQEMIHAERERVNRTNSDAELLVELVQLGATRAAALGEKNVAIELALKHLDMIIPRGEDLGDACRWALNAKLHPVVLELQRRNERAFDNDAMLLYSAAEAEFLEGNLAAAERLADRALRFDPLTQTPPTRPDETAKPNPAKPDADDAGENDDDAGENDDDAGENDDDAGKGGNDASPLRSPKRLEESALRRLGQAREMEDRGLARWALREFRYVTDSLEVTTLPSMLARVELADLLAQRLDHAGAIAALEPLRERIEKDARARRLFLQAANSLPTVGGPRGLESLIDFQKGLLAVAQNRTQDAKRFLTAGFEKSEKANIDILIAMYRVRDDEVWRRRVLAYLGESIGKSEEMIRRARLLNRRGPFFIAAQTQLESALNQYAWLVSNTEGDFARALRCSEESLRIRPGTGAYLDTCARCFYAAGKLVEAVQMQKAALKTLPHSPPLKRQLAEFQKALSTKKNATDSLEPIHRADDDAAPPAARTPAGAP